MTRIAGVALLLVALTATLYAVSPNALQWRTAKPTLNEQALFGILTIGVATVIITGGIDLSLGAVVALAGVGFCVLIKRGYSPAVAMMLVILGGAVIGWIHAALITRFDLQPFLVTLCGLFIYRGLARVITGDSTVGIDSSLKHLKNQGVNTDSFEAQIRFLEYYLIGFDEKGLVFPMMTIVLAVVALAVGLVLHRGAMGRYWYAIGYNVQAARYAGIRVERNKFAVYMLASTLAALVGVLSALDSQSVNPGNKAVSWELYAITGAVLGGCSLRGGEGTIPGMILGAAVLPLLDKLLSFAGSQPWMKELVEDTNAVQPVMIGLTLLLGTLVDEYFRNRARRRS